MSRPVVLVSTRKKYLEEGCFGHWIFVDDHQNHDSLSRACLEAHGDEVDPEIVFLDHQGFHASLFSERGLGASIWTYLRLRALLGREVVDAGLDLGIPVSELDARFYGVFCDQARLDAQYAQDQLSVTLMHHGCVYYLAEVPPYPEVMRIQRTRPSGDRLPIAC